MFLFLAFIRPPLPCRYNPILSVALEIPSRNERPFRGSRYTYRLRGAGPTGLRFPLLSRDARCAEVDHSTVSRDKPGKTDRMSTTSISRYFPRHPELSPRSAKSAIWIGSPLNLTRQKI